MAQNIQVIADLDVAGLIAAFAVTRVEDATDNREEIIGLIQYSGFDPIRIANLVNSKRPQTDAGLKDVYTLIMLAVERGNSVNNIIKNLLPEGAALVKPILQRFGITSRVGENAGNALTLSRIASSFPWITCHYIRHARNPVISFAEMDEIILEQ